MLVAFPDIKKKMSIYIYYFQPQSCVEHILTPIRRWKQTPIRRRNWTKRYWIMLSGAGCHWKVYCERNLEQWRELWVALGQAKLSRVDPDQTRPGGAIFLPPLRLVWFWMGCSFCPQTHLVETCAGIVRSELEGDRPLCNTQEQTAGVKDKPQRYRQGLTSVHNTTQIYVS